MISWIIQIFKILVAKIVIISSIAHSARLFNIERLSERLIYHWWDRRTVSRCHCILWSVKHVQMISGIYVHELFSGLLIHYMSYLILCFRISWWVWKHALFIISADLIYGLDVNAATSLVIKILNTGRFQRWTILFKKDVGILSLR